MSIVDDSDDATQYASFIARLMPVARHRRNTPNAELQINLALLRGMGLCPPVHQQALIAAQYRQIKRPLVVNARVGGAPRSLNTKTIMVASALPGEGKTFTSINLAMSLAQEKDIEVLLTDADLSTAQLSTVLQAKGFSGLLECLEDETLNPESLVLPTNIPGLSFLPAGNPRENSTELLSSLRMVKVLRQLHQGSVRRIVVLDSSALLANTESQVLASLVGQVVLVVRAGHTSQKAVLDAINQLGGGAWIGLVLNQSETGGNREKRSRDGNGSDS